MEQPSPPTSNGDDTGDDPSSSVVVPTIHLNPIIMIRRQLIRDVVRQSQIFDVDMILSVPIDMTSPFYQFVRGYINDHMDDETNPQHHDSRADWKEHALERLCETAHRRFLVLWQPPLGQEVGCSSSNNTKEPLYLVLNPYLYAEDRRAILDQIHLIHCHCYPTLPMVPNAAATLLSSSEPSPRNALPARPSIRRIDPNNRKRSLPQQSQQGANAKAHACRKNKAKRKCMGSPAAVPIPESNVIGLMNGMIGYTSRTERDYLLDYTVRPNDHLGRWIQTLDQSRNDWKEHAMDATLQRGGRFLQWNDRAPGYIVLSTIDNPQHKQTVMDHLDMLANHPYFCLQELSIGSPRNKNEDIGESPSKDMCDGSSTNDVSMSQQEPHSNEQLIMSWTKSTAPEASGSVVIGPACTMNALGPMLVSPDTTPAGAKSNHTSATTVSSSPVQPSATNIPPASDSRLARIQDLCQETTQGPPHDDDIHGGDVFQPDVYVATASGLPTRLTSLPRVPIGTTFTLARRDSPPRLDGLILLLVIFVMALFVGIMICSPQPCALKAEPRPESRTWSWSLF